MALQGPDPDDKRKLHAEINQIVNQRLSVTILSVTVFGAMLAWLTPKSAPAPGSDIGAFIYFGALVLVSVLFALFLLTHHLSYMLRLFTTYLDMTGASSWESDWSLFRKKHTYVGYTQSQTLIFLSLGIVAAIYPYLLGVAYSLSLAPVGGVVVCVLAGIAYAVFVYGMGIKGWFAQEEKIRKQWQSLKK